MTKPSLTYGHKYLDDCNCSDPTTFYTENLYNMAGAHATPSILYGDILQIQAIFDEGATNEYVYYEKDITNFSSNTYPYFMLRWKTSESANGALAKAMLIFTVGDQVILPASYNTTWQVTSGTITADKTVDKIQFWADDDGTNGTFYVYFDFLLLHKGIFNFPFVDGTEELTVENDIGYLKIYGRTGNITQHKGMDSPLLRLTGTMDANTNWGTPDGEYLYYIIKTMDKDPWQWLSSDLINCKVTVPKFTIKKDPASKRQRVWGFDMRKYDLSSGSEILHGDMEWFGFE